MFASDTMAINVTDPNFMEGVKEYIIWCDVETTGLDENVDFLLEIGAVITDMHGNRIGDTFSQTLKVDNLSEVIEKCSPQVRKMHTENCLFEHLWVNGSVSPAVAEEMFYSWVKETVGWSFGDDSFVFYFGGRSITLDRKFLLVNTPMIHDIFSHKSIDLTSCIIMLSRNFPQVNRSVFSSAKTVAHRALQDSIDCVEQYRSIISAFNNIVAADAA